MADDPGFRQNRKYYVDYNPPDGRTHLVDERQFNSSFNADACAVRRIISVATNSGQNRNSLNGKILRLNVDLPAGGLVYGLPSDNPFQGPGERGEIFAMGFRNPRRIGFDPAGGALWAGDVGQSSFEEVDRVVQGYAPSSADMSTAAIPSPGSTVSTYSGTINTTDRSMDSRLRALRGPMSRSASSERESAAWESTRKTISTPLDMITGLPCACRVAGAIGPDPPPSKGLPFPIAGGPPLKRGI